MRTLNRVSQYGTTLIEVVVAIFVMSIGMLGMAGLTAASSSNNKLVQIKSTSLMLVSDYADRARANLTGFDANNYQKTSVYAPSSTLLQDGNCAAISSPCTAANMASEDQNQWLNIVRRRLPAGDAYVTTSKVGGLRSMDIWVMWAEAEQNQDFDLRALDIGNLLGGGKIFPCPAAAVAPDNVRCLYFRIGI